LTDSAPQSVNRTSSTVNLIDLLADAVRVHELIAVLRALDEAGTTPLVFKGAALAHTHYAESWQRPRLDADILIAPDSRERVFATLSGLGYGRPPLISGDLVMYQAPFARIDHLGIEHALDIHWRTANPQVVSTVLSHGELVERSVIVGVEGYPMRVPSPVDALLIACVHRAAHHSGLDLSFWIEDIHLLASRFSASEWRAFVERAARRSIRGLCLQGLRRAKEAFHTAVPGEVLAALSAVTGEASAVFLRSQLRPIDRLRADLRALGPVAAARLVREHLFPPADYMQAKYGVTGTAWLPAYYASRALHGIRKWWRPYVSETR
jgi:hypothetical protein